MRLTTLLLPEPQGPFSATTVPSGEASFRMLDARAFANGLIPKRSSDGSEIGKLLSEGEEARDTSFSLDGKYAYPDGGAVIDTATKKVAARIPTSEKLIEIDFRDAKPVKAGHR